LLRCCGSVLRRSADRNMLSAPKGEPPPLYQQFQASAPALGARVSTPDGDGRVVGHSVPRDAVVVRMDADGSRCTCSRASVCGSRQSYEERYRS